jgi:hypothetical protein
MTRPSTTDLTNKFLIDEFPHNAHFNEGRIAKTLSIGSTILQSSNMILTVHSTTALILTAEGTHFAISKNCTCPDEAIDLNKFQAGSNSLH